MWEPPMPKNTFLRCIYLMFRRYLRHGVGIQSAALAFYLLFTIFPFLIFVSALLGLLQLDVAGILQVLEDFLPREVVNLVGVYLTYVRENPSPQLMVFGLAFSVYFPMRAANSLMRAVRTAYHLGPPRHALVHYFKSLLYTVLLILDGTRADGDIGQQVFHIAPVLRVEHLVGAGKTAFLDRANVHFAHGDQSLNHVRRFFRIRL